MSFSGLDLWRKKQLEEEERRKKVGEQSPTLNWRRSYGPDLPQAAPQQQKPLPLQFDNPDLQVTSGQRPSTAAPSIAASTVEEETVKGPSRLPDLRPQGYDPLASLTPPKRKPLGYQAPAGSAIVPSVLPQAQGVKDVWDITQQVYKNYFDQGGTVGKLAGTVKDLATQADQSALGALVEQTGAQYNQAMDKAMKAQPGSDLPVIGPILKALAFPTVAAGPTLQFLDSLSGIANVPGTEQNLGQVWSAAMGAGGKVMQEQGANNAPYNKDNNWLGINLPKSWEDLNSRFNTVGKNFDSLMSFATYMQDELNGINASLVPTSEQQAQHTAQEIAEARNNAMLMSWHGRAAIGQQFDDLLDYKPKGQKLLDEAKALSDQAYQTQEGPARQAMLIEAGKLGMQAVKLINTTPLELYDKNANWYYALPFEALFGLTNTLDWGAGILDITPQARRLKQGQELSRMARDAVEGSNKPLSQMAKDLVLEWQRTGRSKTLVDAYTNFSVMANLISGLSTKGDIATVLTKYITNPGELITGTPVQFFQGADAALQATDGLLQFGWSGIKDYRAVKAQKALAGMEVWVSKLPSLSGDMTEVANKVEVMGDLMGALIRSGADKHGVSLLADVPWGAAEFVVTPAQGNKATIQVLDASGSFLKQLPEMTLLQANKTAERMRKALAAGQEFRTNYVDLVGSFQRNLMSSLNLNGNPAAILNNMIGGNLTGMMDQGFSHEWLKPLEEQAEYLTAKLGGMAPSMRYAEGVLDVEAAASTTNKAYRGQGFGTGKSILSKLLWPLEQGKKIRQGAATVAGGRLKAGEEAIAGNLYYTAFKSFFEQEWAAGAEKAVGKLAQEYGVTDSKALKGIIDAVTQAGLNGNRVDVAKVFQELVAGRRPISLRSISPLFADVFTDAQVQSIDTWLRTLDTQNLPQAQAEIRRFIVEQRNRFNKGLDEYPGMAKKQVWTKAEDQADLSNLMQQLQTAVANGATFSDESMQTIQNIQADLQTINQGLLNLLQMSNKDAHLIDYVYGVWHDIQTMRTNARTVFGTFANDIQRSAAADPTFDKVAAWQRYDSIVQGAWSQFGLDAKAKLSVAMREIADGTAVAKMRQQINAQVQGMVNQSVGGYTAPNFNQYDELLNTLSVDMDEVIGLLNQDLGWASHDPLFNTVIAAARKGLDKYQAEMYTMLQRYPTQESFDEFMSAIQDVSKWRRALSGNLERYKQAALDAKALGDPVAEGKAWKIYLEAKNRGWRKWWMNAYARYHTGAMRIVEANLPQGFAKDLEFHLPGENPAAPAWRLWGPDAASKKPLWWVIDPAGGKRTLNVGPGGIPQNVIDRFQELRLYAEKEVADQVGRAAVKAGETGTGVGEIDKLIADIATGKNRDIYAQVRANVQQYFTNYAGQSTIPGDVPAYMSGLLDSATRALEDLLPQLVQMNPTGMGKLDISAVNRFNSEVLPLFDNIIAGAQRYADEMTSLSVLNYTNQYHPDVLLGLAVPYHFFFTRQAKNSLERLLFSPKWQAHIMRYNRALQSANRKEGQPERNQTTIPIDINLGGRDSYRLDIPLPRWIPVYPLMVQNGWADPSRANQGFEFAVNAMKEQGWPVTAQGIWGALGMAQQVGERGGFSTYPWIEDFLAARNQYPQAVTGADYSPYTRLLGWGLTAFADNLRAMGVPVPQGGPQSLLPGYKEYLYGREAAFQAGAGQMSDDQAKWVQDVAAQKAQGLGPLPEQPADAVANYNQVSQDVGWEYFVRSLISWATGLRVAPVYGPEQGLNQAQQDYYGRGYNPGGNIAGSREGRQGMFDPSSPEFVPGLSSYMGRYAVTGEEGPKLPQQPVPNVYPFNPPNETRQRPGEGAVKGEFYQARDALNAQFDAQEQAYLASVGDITEENSFEVKDKLGEIGAERRAAMDALKLKYPTMADQEYERDAGSLSGASPQETVEQAKLRLYYQAKENVANLLPAELSDAQYEALSRSEKQANKQAWDAYNEAWRKEWLRLMADPQAASQSVFGQPLGIPGTGASSPLPPFPGTQTPLPGAPGGQTSPQTSRNLGAATAPSTGAATPVPVMQGNQWADLMAAEEQKYGLPTGILQGLAANESGFDPQAKGGNGVGLMQFEPPAWSEAQAALGVTDRTDPEQSIQAAAWYLDLIRSRLPADKRDDWFWVLAAYNQGAGRVGPMTDKSQVAEVQASTVPYIDRILAGTQQGQAPLAEPSSAGTTGGVTFPFGGTPNLTQSYGVNPERYKSWGGHMGLDYQLDEGTPILATQDGEVVGTGYSPAGGTPAIPGTGGFGNFVLLKTADGYQIEYAHFSQVDVKTGDRVTAGQTLGLSGNTGVSDFPHLHFGVRKDGKYIDPTTYLDRQVAVTPTPVQAPAIETRGPATGTGQTTGTGLLAGMDGNAEFDRLNNRFDSGARRTAEQQLEGVEQGRRDRVQQAYPDYFYLLDEYKGINDEERQAYREAHPEVRAVNLAAYNRKGWEYVQQTWGEDAALRYARIPPYQEGGNPATGDYYRQDPDAFLIKSWLNGRPEPFDDNAQKGSDQFTWNNGADYAEAQAKFGNDIWDIVRQAKQLPAYIPGDKSEENRAAGKAWAEFHDKFPQYSSWSDWWYAKLPPREKSQSSNGYAGYRPSTGGWEPGSRLVTHAPNPYRRSYDLPEPAKIGESGGSMGDGWRKWLALSESELRGWRR